MNKLALKSVIPLAVLTNINSELTNIKENYSEQTVNIKKQQKTETIIAGEPLQGTGKVVSGSDIEGMLNGQEVKSEKIGKMTMLWVAGARHYVHKRSSGDFDDAFAHLNKLSNDLAAATVSGTTTSQWSALTFTPTSTPSDNVYVLNGYFNLGYKDFGFTGEYNYKTSEAIRDNNARLYNSDGSLILGGISYSKRKLGATFRENILLNPISGSLLNSGALFFATEFSIFSHKTTPFSSCVPLYKFIPSFSWGGASGLSTFQPRKFNEVAKAVMSRRSIDFNEQEKSIIDEIFVRTADYRIWDKK